MRGRELIESEVRYIDNDVQRFSSILDNKLQSLNRVRWINVSFSKWRQLVFLTDIQVRDHHDIFRKNNSISVSPVRNPTPQRYMFFGSTERKRHSSYD
jgi:hypothetical protein